MKPGFAGVWNILEYLLDARKFFLADAIASLSVFGCADSCQSSKSFSYFKPQPRIAFKAEDA